MSDNAIDSATAIVTSMLPSNNLENFVDDSANTSTTASTPSKPAFLDEESEQTEELTEVTEGVSDKSSVPAKTENGDMVEVSLGDKTSRVKIDMNNKEQIKKAVIASVQAKHFMAQQTEKMSAMQKQMEELKDYQASFGEVEQAFKSKGMEGLIDLMSGKEGAYQEFLQKQVAREMLKRDASPAELEKIELEERLESLTKKAAAHEGRAKQAEEQASTKATAAEKARIEGAIQPAFEKFRFNGELNNPALEAKLDKTIWMAALDELKEYSTEHGQAAITPQVTNKIFQHISKEIKEAFSVQSNNEAKVSAEKRKADAGFKVAATALAGQASNSGRQSDKELYNKLLRAGDYSGMLTMVQSGKVR